MDNHTESQRKLNMSHIRSSSKSEEIVRHFLFSKGFRYRKNDKRYAGKPDIVLPKYKTIIFINGCFWHQHNGCKGATIPKTNVSYWENKLRNNCIRDKANIDILNKQKWNVIVIWECMLSHKKIEETLNNLILDIINSFPGVTNNENNRFTTECANFN